MNDIVIGILDKIIWAIPVPEGLDIDVIANKLAGEVTDYLTWRGSKKNFVRWDSESQKFYRSKGIP